MSSGSDFFRFEEHIPINILITIHYLNTSIWYPLSLLVCSVVKQYCNKLLSWLRHLNCGISLVALRCILSSLSMSFLRYGFHVIVFLITRRFSLPFEGGKWVHWIYSQRILRVSPGEYGACESCIWIYLNE